MVVPKVMYVAGPYGAETKVERDFNIAQARKTQIILIRKGWIVYLPHGNYACMDDVFEEIGLLRAYFLRAGLFFLNYCSAIVLLPGYSESEGTMDYEIPKAKELNLPIFKSVDDVPNMEDFEEQSKF